MQDIFILDYRIALEVSIVQAMQPVRFKLYISKPQYQI